MFTGIISHTGKFVRRTGGLFVFQADESICKKLPTGASIAVNGVCLTVAKPPLKTLFSATVMPETIKRTMLGSLHENDSVNLELPMTPEGFLEGHIVQGHVDGIGILGDMVLEGNSRILKIIVGTELSKYIVEKGSIALNGISLTVIKAEKTYFTVGIIPHTWSHTMLKQIKTGDKVNLETDIIGKYVGRSFDYSFSKLRSAQDDNCNFKESHKIAIVSSEFWKEMVESLEKHCIITLEKNGVSKKQIDVIRVPGSLEIPLIAKKLAQKNKYAAIIVFGVIHKGKTYHFELISNECAKGCMEVSLQYEIPVIYEVLSVYNIKDARDRAFGVKGNKGVEAAEAAIKMINLIQKI